MANDTLVFTTAPRHCARPGPVRRIALVLLVVTTTGIAWDQPSAGTLALATSQETSPAPASVPDIPVDDLNRGTPRRAVNGFLQASRARDFQRAAGYLDLRPPAAEESMGPTLARQLKVVIDQKLPIDVEALTDRPDGNRNDGLPPDVEQIGRIDTLTGPVHLRLQR